MRSSSAASSARSDWLLTIAATLVCALVGLGSGVWLGRATSPLVDVEASGCPGPVGGAGLVEPSLSPEVAAALAASFARALELASELDSLEQLAAEIEARGLSPSEGAGLLVEGLRDQDLSRLTEMIAQVSEAQMGAIDDPRAFAIRLVEEALAVELDGAGGEADLPSRQVSLLFTAEEELQHPDQVAANVFPSGTRSIFAMLDSRSAGGETWMVRWTRADRHEILSYAPASVTPGSNWTALAYSPGGPWRKGRYQVTVYRMNGAMERVAEGTFTVVDGGQDEPL